MSIFPRIPKLDKQGRQIRNRISKVLNKEASAGLNRITVAFDVEDRGQDSTHIVADEDVLTFVRSSLELHYEPGINPHSEVVTSPVQFLMLEKLQPSGPYWWTVPGLQENYDKRGAVVWSWGFPSLIWVRPGVELTPDLIQYTPSTTG